VSDSTGLRGIFSTKREKVTGSLRKLHTEELHNLHISSNIVKMLKSKMGRASHTHGREQKYVQSSCGKV
jgi:hypothetical protein